MHRGLRNDMADAVSDKDFNGNLRICLFVIGKIDHRACDAIRHFVRVCRIYFFKHNQMPFLSCSSLFRSSFGFMPV
jgi:hypothetical protein